MKIREFKMRASAADLLLVKPTKGIVSAGTLTYLQEWLVLQTDGRQREIDSKYIRKGHEREQDSLNRIAQLFGISELPKNEQFYKNDYFCGTPDALHGGIVFDAKTAYDKFTMPYFGELNRKYATQMQVYMELTGCNTAYVCHCLENPTDAELDYKGREYEEVTEEVWQELIDRYGFDHLPDEMRIVSFRVDPDPAIIEQLQNGVSACRKALHEVVIPQFEKSTGIKVEIV